MAYLRMLLVFVQVAKLVSPLLIPLLYHQKYHLKCLLASPQRFHQDSHQRNPRVIHLRNQRVNRRRTQQEGLTIPLGSLLVSLRGSQQRSQ